MLACKNRFTAVLSLVMCALAPLFSLYCLLNLYVDYFFWDEWNLLVRFSALIFDRNKYAWHVLWEPHFSHRLVLLKLLSAANFQFSGGNQLPLLLLAWLVQVSLFLTLLMDRHLRFVPSTDYVTGAFCLSLVLFTPSMALAWVWPVCLQQLLTALFFCWTMVLTGRLAGNSSLLPVISFAILCTFASGNGVVVWPACVMLGFLIRVPPRRLLGISVAGAITLMLYFHEMPVEAIGASPTALHDKVLYFFAFIGSPFSNRDSSLAIALGSAGLILHAFLFFIALWQKNVASIVGASLAWLTIASAYAGANYRIGDGGIEQALVDRYIPLILPFWASVVVAALCTNAWPVIRMIALAILIALGASSFVHVTGPNPIDPKAFQGARHSLVRLAREGFEEKAIVTSRATPYVNLYPDITYVIALLLDMKRLAVGPFRQENQSGAVAGISLGDKAMSCNDCECISSAGTMESTVEPIHVGIDTCKAGYEQGAVVRGMLSIDPGRVREILIVNEHHEVVGKGFPVGQFRSGPDPTSIRYSGERPWVGFVSGKYFPKDSDSRIVKGLVHLHDGARCLLQLDGHSIVGADLVACNLNE